MNINSRILLQEGFVLLILTVSAFIISFYYEIGYCKYYGIPNEYVSIDVSKNGNLIFSVIVFLYFLTLIRLGYTYLINRSKGLFKHLLKLLVISIFAYLFYKSQHLKTVAEGGILLVTLTIAQGIIHYSENLIEKSSEDNSLTIPILLFRVSGEAGLKIGHFLYVFVMGCFLFLSFGYFTAQKEKKYYAKDGGHLALIKRYGNTNFYCLIKNDTLFLNKILIEEGSSKIETFQTISVKSHFPN